jgi:integrase
MTSYAKTLDQLLASPRTAATKALLAGMASETLREDVAQLDAHILKNAPAGDRLDRLIDLAHAKILALYPEKAAFLRQKATYEYPTYRNVLTEGIAEASQIYARGERWLEERRKSRKPPTPRARIAQLMVAMVLDFQLLDRKIIPPLLESMRDLRIVPLEKRLVGILLLMRRGDTSQERFLSVGGEEATNLGGRLKRPDVQAWLGALIASCGEDSRRALDSIDAEIQSGAGVNIFRMAELIEAASQVAITHVPTSVLAVRTGLTTSHALKLSALQRIAGFSFDDGKKDDANAQKDSGEPAEDADEEFDRPLATEPGWRTDLRAAVRKTAVDEELLKAMANSPEPAARWIGLYALGLGAKNRSISTIYKYVGLVADRLLLRLGDSDPAAIETDEWEELVEQILDEDAYYHRGLYSGQGNRDSAGYSRSLIKVLRGFATLVHGGKKGIHPLASLLPNGGLVRVDANFVTVDEFREALDCFRTHHFDGLKRYFNTECRAALILGFRLGLRRSEVAFLRACDFDEPLKGEDFRTANLHLHVRPWLMRKLKTSNAERDLPLSPLVPEDELEELLEFVHKARKLGKEARLFRTREKQAEGMKFDRVAEALHKAFLGTEESARSVPVFHFHMLRHSAAAAWLLKLWETSLGTVARCVFRNHPLMLAWMDKPGFRADLLGTDHIRGSDLQICAFLLGHGSSAVSVEHYLHVLEWYRKEEVEDSEARHGENFKPQSDPDYPARLQAEVRG